MATISFQVAETGQTTLTKTITLSDSQLDRLIIAYQAPANDSLGTIATRAQVLNYWVVGVIISRAITDVLVFERSVADATVTAITPA